MNLKITADPLCTSINMLIKFLLLAAISQSEARKSDRRSHDGPPRQIQANCPANICQCNKTVIQCVDTNARDTGVFLGITDQLYPEMDTLIIEGNDFGELEPVNLFAISVHHERLSKLSLARNGIKSVHGNIFQSSPNIQELDLSSNRISKVEGDLLGRLNNLHTLNLRNAFADVSAEQIQGIFQDLFINSRNKFTHLANVYLDDNVFIYLPRDAFCRLQGLEVLSLRNTSLRGFAPANSSCLNNVYKLDLSDNNIGTISKEDTAVLDGMIHLQEADFSENPFECNCYLKDFVDWYQTSDEVVGKDDTGCFSAEPETFEESLLDELNSSLLLCSSDDSSYLHTVYIFLTLALIALCLLMACVFYANRGVLCKKTKNFSLGKARFSVAGGYEPLGKEPEVKAEFV